MKRRPCLGCCSFETINGKKKMIPADKRAKIPEKDPMFCSLKCGCEYAIWLNNHNGENELVQSWCDTHRLWYVSLWGCEDCESKD